MEMMSDAMDDAMDSDSPKRQIIKCKSKKKSKPQASSTIQSYEEESKNSSDELERRLAALTSSPREELIKISTSIEPIISAQDANGFWSQLAVLQAYLKPAQRESIAALAQQYPIEIVCTVLALVILNSQFSEKKSEWDMIQKKAKKWLKLQEKTEEVRE